MVSSLDPSTMGLNDGAEGGAALGKLGPFIVGL